VRYGMAVRAFLVGYVEPPLKCVVFSSGRTHCEVEPQEDARRLGEPWVVPHVTLFRWLLLERESHPKVSHVVLTRLKAIAWEISDVPHGSGGTGGIARPQPAFDGVLPLLPSFLQARNIGKDRVNIVGLEHELGHVTVPHDNALDEGLGEMLDRIPLRQFAKGRCFGVRALSCRTHGVAARAFALRDHASAIQRQMLTSQFICGAFGEQKCQRTQQSSH